MTVIEIFSNEDELYQDQLINAPWFAAKQLLDNVSNIPTERIYEAMNEIDNAIQLLALAKIELEEKKQ